MAKKEQEEASKDPQEALREVLEAVVKPFQEAQEAFQQTQISISKNVQRNAANIKKLANNPKPEPLLPKEVTKLLPGLIQGVIKIFTQPDTAPAAASKGIFDETMMNAYKKSTIAIWEMNAKMTQANLDKINLDNDMVRKRLKEEI